VGASCIADAGLSIICLRLLVAPYARKARRCGTPTYLLRLNKRLTPIYATCSGINGIRKAGYAPNVLSPSPLLFEPPPDYAVVDEKNPVRITYTRP
jgi:hypothetical protein